MLNRSIALIRSYRLGTLGVAACVGLLSLLSSPAAWSDNHASRYIDSPALITLVEAGELPPVDARLPEHPRVIPMDGTRRTAGRHGGQWRMLINRSKDVKLFSVYGYARLVHYSDTLELVPDILEDIIIEEGRTFTLKLRKGHRWSDGHPFTAEDFRYWWEDVANNDDLSPSGPPRVLLVDDKPPQVEFIDDWTVRFTWDQPNPLFLPALAGASPLFIYRPAHYLGQFHQLYKNAGKKKKKSWRTRNWASEHNRMDNQYKSDNPDLPTLQPWVNTTRPPATRFVGLRNPYFHRVDPAGRQLPYIDEITMIVADGKLIPAKAGSGEVDLQARGLKFSDYTFLKEGEERHNFDVRLWRTATGAHLALYPNLNVNDPVYQALFRDVRFRRALSLAVNRHEINQVMYFGLALEANNLILPDSPLYNETTAYAWAGFDIDRANALLDEIGLTEFNDDDIRLMANGQPLELIIETAGEDTEQTDVLQLVSDSWKQIGVKIYTKPSQREVFRNRIFSGETHMSIWSGYDNGVPTADMSPTEFTPTQQMGLHWPKWGQWYESKGSAGEPPEMQVARDLLNLHTEWLAAGSRDARERIWQSIIKLHADNVLTIGLVAGVLQPVLVHNSLRNIPDKGIYSWDPGAHFGIYMPDTFWFDD